MMFDDLPQAPITTETVSPTWRSWFSNNQSKLKTIPVELVSVTETNDIDSVNLEKSNRKLIFDVSSLKLYLVLNGVKHQIKLA
jgi:hypothetical protein